LKHGQLLAPRIENEAPFSMRQKESIIARKLVPFHGLEMEIIELITLSGIQFKEEQEVIIWKQAIRSITQDPQFLNPVKGVM
jgi:hypothetical protein